MFEIFRAGLRTDNKGHVHEISAADVAAAAAAYDPSLHVAPLVVGHPNETAPAWGWVAGVAADNGTLTADFAQVDHDFAELVRAGKYKKVSASFYPPQHPANPKPGVWYLRHVGFLGAHPPAVKGLAAINFAEDVACVEFSEAAHGYAAKLFRNIREFIIAKFGAEEADRVVPDWQIQSITENATRDSASFAEYPSTNPITEPKTQTHDEKETLMSPEDQATLAAEKAAREQAEADAAKARAELKQLQDKHASDLRDAAHAANADFAEGLVQAGRLKPADKNLVVQVLDFAEYPESATADFGEGDAKKPFGAALRDFLAAVLPVQLPAGHVATAAPARAPGVSADFAEASDPDALSHHERAQALMAKEGISYEQAARRTAAV